MAGDLDQNNWKDMLKGKFPQYFSGVRVLDIGSCDMNGTNKPWFTNCEYIGLDIKAGPNVDVVSIAHEYKAPPQSFDVVISTNQLEHDMYWDKTLLKMYELLKSNGLLVIQCPHNRGEHGTITNSPADSLTTQIKDDFWAGWYKNFDIQEIKAWLDVDHKFSLYDISYQPLADQRDIYFWGIKGIGKY